MSWSSWCLPFTCASLKREKQTENAIRDKKWVVRKDKGESADSKKSIGLALHDKIVQNDAKGAEELIAAGADVNEGILFATKVFAPDRRTVYKDIIAYPLHVACIYRRPKIVEMLLKNGAVPNLTDKLGRCPVQLVITYWPRLMVCLDQKAMSKEDIEYQSYLKRQHERCKDCLVYLCESGANIDIQINSEKETLAHLAAKHNITWSIDVLSKYGANLNARDSSGCTPALTAARYGSFEFLFLMIDLGLDVTVKDNFGCTILSHACENDRSPHAKHVNKLLKLEGLKGMVNTQDANGNSPLHVAAGGGREAAIHALIEHGAHPDLVNISGCSILFNILDSYQNARCHCGLQKILAETLQVKIMDNSFREPLLLGLPEFTNLREALLKASKIPASLQMACRNTIRQALGYQRLNADSLFQLPCAPKLSRYVLLNTLKYC
ncbi:ankyrin repeat domain-containing protein 61-like [Lineus longissimus]|uniref:ankyrin repeat domain-containing protein 61-like n=1 Tax=Lineus longissimus TaxID=88925 RepID=UPI00315DEEE8